MKNEIYWLVLTIILTSVVWIPYVLNRIYEHKLIPALKNPNRDSRPKSAWANRMMYAHENAVENLVLFAPLVILISYLQLSTSTTITASMIYFFGRLAHTVIYTLGIPYVRTLSFAIAWGAQFYLAIIILRSL